VRGTRPAVGQGPPGPTAPWLPVLVAALVLLPGTAAPLGGQDRSEPDRPGSLTAMSEGFEALAERVRPAVVQIVSTGIGLPAADEGRGSGRSLAAQRTTGSGVILDPRGYIVTNAHLVEAAERVHVSLARRHPPGHPEQSILEPSGERRDADIIGIDRETDLAVLKIDGTDLPHLTLADSDSLRLGQLVFAFGNPLGLQNSASVGVVSSVARQLRPEDPMIYVQTDAAINPGSSGGPLVNSDGGVVGVNTFILSRSGGSEGIGFAAPSNIVEHVYREILDHGRVRRGVIGVHAQTVTPTLAEALDLPRSWGVILADVLPGSPAAEAGLAQGDLVLSLNGQPMENGRQFDVNVYPFGPGDTVDVGVLRRGRRVAVPVPVVRRPDDPDRIAELVNPEENLVPSLGILALPLDPRLQGMLGPLRKSTGVVVAAVAGDAVPGPGRFRAGDVIHTVNNVPVTNLVELRVALDKLSAGDPVALQVQRSGRLRYLSFEMR